MPVAGDDRRGGVRASERDEIVVVRIVGRSWSRLWVFDTDSALRHECNECLRTAVRRDPVELLPAENPRQLCRQQRLRDTHRLVLGQLAHRLRRLKRSTVDVQTRGARVSRVSVVGVTAALAAHGVQLVVGDAHR